MIRYLFTHFGKCRLACIVLALIAISFYLLSSFTFVSVQNYKPTKDAKRAQPLVEKLRLMNQALERKSVALKGAKADEIYNLERKIQELEKENIALKKTKSRKENVDNLLQMILRLEKENVALKGAKDEIYNLEGKIQKLEKENIAPMKETKSRKENVDNLLQMIQKLEKENVALKGIISKKKSNAKENKNKKHFTATLLRPLTHELANDATIFAKMVTVILHQQSKVSLSCLQEREKNLRETFPNVVILRPDHKSSPGKAFNLLFSKVTTKYFLFLNGQHELAEQSSDHSPGWLLHALENIPELDFVSGSVLDPETNNLEIPCYRLLLCNWTLITRYEYERSVGELMVCENIAKTFMGRTSSVRRLFPGAEAFDGGLPLLSHTDFFLRAKKAGAISGVRPEVIYTAINSSQCTGPRTTKRKYFKNLLPFAHKHKVFQFKDSDDHVLDLCGEESPILGEDICDEKVAHEVMMDNGHWAYDGAFAYPYINRNLLVCLFKVTEFLQSKGLPFSIEGGAALGALKLRRLQPWDAGDVDIYVFFESVDKLLPIVSKFARENDFTFRMIRDSQVQVFCAPTRLGKKMGGLVSLFVRNKEPPQFVHLQTNGRWIPFRKDIFGNCRRWYKTKYFQHRMYGSNDHAHCTKKGHNACLPDFRTVGGFNGTGGTFKEFFCRES